MPALLEFQKRMTDAIRHGVANLDAPSALLDLLTNPGRLAIHRRHTRRSLSDAIAARFPAVQRLVGEEFFAFVAAQFIAASPPTDARVVRYGDEFPTFLESRSEASSFPWLADVARIEVAMHRASIAPVQVTTGIEALGEVPPDRLADAQVVWNDAAFLLRSDWPAASLWRLGLSETAPTRVDVASLPASRLLVSVIGGEAQAFDLPQADEVFLAAMQRGATLGVAADSAMSASAEFDLTQAIGILFGRRCVTSVAVTKE